MKKSSPEPAELFLRLRAALRWQNSIIIDFPASFAALLFQTGAGLILLLSVPMIGRFGNPASKKAFGLILRMPQPVEKPQVGHYCPQTALRWFAGKVLRHKG